MDVMRLIALISKDVFSEKSRSATTKCMILALIYMQALRGVLAGGGLSTHII